MPSLLDIADDILAVQRLLEDSADEHGALSDEANAILDAWIATIETDKEDKLNKYGSLIRETELARNALAAEIQRLAAKSATKDNLLIKLKERLRLFMETTGQPKLHTKLFDFAVTNNGGKTPVRIDVPADELPAAFQINKIEPDKESIRTALENGQAIPGCTLLPRGTHLRIR